METGNKHKPAFNTPSIQPTLSIFENLPGIELSLNCHLSLVFGNGSFAYAILDQSGNRFIGLEAYSLADLRIDSIEKIVAGQPLLKQPFRSVSAAVENDRNTLIPSPLFSESGKADYLRLNLGNDHEQVTETDNLRNLDARNVYLLPAGFKQRIHAIFPQARLMHHASTLIESLIILHRNQLEKKAFVHYHEPYFEVVIIENGKLLFFNTFQIQSKEDFIYFLLYIFGQQELYPESSVLTVIGQIPEKSDIMELIGKYIRNVSLWKRPQNVSYIPSFSQVPEHYYFNLFNQHLCV